MQKFIDFNLPDSNGEYTKLSEVLKESNVWLFFFRGNWWGTWAKQLSQVCEKYEELKSNYNVRILGISVDSVEESKDFKESLGLPFELLSDFDREVIRAYDLVDPRLKDVREISLSAFILIKQDGDILYFNKETKEGRPDLNELFSEIEKM